MTRFKSMDILLLIPLTLLLGAVITQADASWFHDRDRAVSRNVGSAANPTPRDLIVISRGPDYPVRSKMFKEEGTVELNLWLTESGSVSAAAIEHSSGYKRLDDAAVRFMKDRWHYTPAGRQLPMPKTVQAEVTFKLD